MSEIERLRISHAGRDAFELERPGAGASRFVGRVLTSSPVVGEFMLVRPVAVTGDQAEGATPTFTDLGTADVPVLLLGPGVPATGSHVVVRPVDSRWVAKRRGTGGGGPITGGPLLGCTCPTPPAVLTMTSSGTCVDDILHPCTIEWQATPAWAASLGWGADTYLSNESFFDAGGYEYHYRLICSISVFVLQIVWIDFAGLGPLSNNVYVWTLGFPGNTCSPFLLSNGGMTVGSMDCSVTISE